MAVQAYQRRACAVVRWADDLGAGVGRRLSVRLVKGAYWDTEIKRAQEQGQADYPVFTRKAATDVSYLACAKAMLQASRLYPAFATHNALTVATVMEWAGQRRDFEFQRLHGMGVGLYERMIEEEGVKARVYAPVGGYRDLLAYLVRRLLENGANSSFVNQLADPAIGEEGLLADPAALVTSWKAGELGATIDRINASGYGLTMGLHSRLGEAADLARSRAHVGNLYVNRSMIGAVVGVQPFGGEGLSGTGPKAGGPHYLFRFVGERTVSIDTTSAGGNASLMTLDA